MCRRERFVVLRDGHLAAGDEARRIEMADPGMLQGVAAEARKVRETADKLAEGDSPEGADTVRVLAGMIRQLAEQVERLAVDTVPAAARGTEPAAARGAGPAVDPEAVQHDRDVVLEEDRSLERAPAAPLADRAD